MGKTGKREQLREDRAVHRALRALAVLEQLDQHATVEALRRPRDFLLNVARLYKLLDTDSGEVRRPTPFIAESLPTLEKIPENLPALTSQELEGFRRIVVEPPEYRDPQGPVPAITVRPHAWAPRLFAERTQLQAWKAASHWQMWEARRSKFLAEWCFDGHPHQSALVEAAEWTRRYLIHLAVRAAEIIAGREALLLRWFVEPIELPVPEAVRLIQQATDPSEIIELALRGRPEAVHQALREAGVAAMDWPWVRTVIGAWRAAADLDDLTKLQHAAARHNLKGIAEALMATGRGRRATVTQEEKNWLRDNRPRLVKAVRALAHSPSSAPADLTPPELKQARRLLKSHNPTDVVDRMLAKSCGITPATARRYALTPKTVKK